MKKCIYSEQHRLVACLLVGILFAILTIALLALVFDGETLIINTLYCFGFLLAMIASPQIGIIFTVLTVIFGSDISELVVNSLNNVDLIKGISAVIGTIGMVSFVLTYINTARTKKLKGILLEDVINAFYPHYKWMLVLNGCLACLGKFGCELHNGITGVLCLLGMIICLCYMVPMANTIVFTERKSRQITDKYIELIASRYYKKQLEGLEEISVTHFIKSVGSYMAELYNKADFSISYTSRENELKNLIPLLRCDHNPPAKAPTDEAIIAFSAFERGTPDILEKHTKANDYCKNCSVFKLPYTEWVRKNINNEIRIACTLWHSILDKTIGSESKAQLACEVICSEYGNGIHVSGTLGAGLIMYLHSTYIPETNPKDDKGWSSCIDFLYYMYTIANDITAERNDLLKGNTPIDKSWLRKRCIDFMMILMGWAMVEQCSSTQKFEYSYMRQTIKTILNMEQHKPDKLLLDDNAIMLYTYYAFLLFDASPLPVLPVAMAYQKQGHFVKISNCLREIRTESVI